MRNRIRGMVTGAIVGAAAIGVLGVMDKGAKQKISRYAAKSARKIGHMASELFGK